MKWSTEKKENWEKKKIEEKKFLKNKNCFNFPSSEIFFYFMIVKRNVEMAERWKKKEIKKSLGKVQ